MNSKDRYSIDQQNRLVIKRKGKILPVKGRFAVDKDNRLFYWLNEPAVFKREHGLPSKINWTGNFSLSPNYDLVFNLKETTSQNRQDRLVLKGKIISLDKDSLVFEVKSIDKRGLLSANLIKLTGSWQADEFNRLVFTVRKKISDHQLIFSGAWQVNKNQQIEYRYEKTELKTKKKFYHILIFKGHWDINSSDRLSYILCRSTKTDFDFRVQAESANLYPRDGVIKYRLGIGLKNNKKTNYRIISLYGAWKFGANLNFYFDMDYGTNKKYSIGFNTSLALNKKDKVVLALKKGMRNPIGMNLVLTHSFLKKLDGELFLRLGGDAKKQSVEAGVRIPF
ncbi:MAG: hypothetical protein ABIH18_03115 [Candidatus Omnitrophota bacterium]